MDEVETNGKWSHPNDYSPPEATVWVARPWGGKHYPVLENHAYGKQGKQTSIVRLEGQRRFCPGELEEDSPQIQFLAKPFHAKSSHYAPHPLKCGVMNYAWGKVSLQSAVAQWKRSGDPGFVVEDVPYAELWIGTHPSAPSCMHRGEPLAEFLQRHPKLLGNTHLRHFGEELPYLLKILSVRTALSIQAHPEKALAEVLHQRDPKHYPDPNHKPEAVVALTTFKAMCSFRPLPQIAHYLRTIGELAALVSPEAVEHLGRTLADPGTSEEARKAALKVVYVQLLECDEERVRQQIESLAARLRLRPLTLDFAMSTFLDLVQQYPGDGGCFQVFFLNIVTLSPGEGLFLAANEPHAYVSGDAVEVMARSDNVVRAGLTPKFKDVHVLGAMLSYDTQDVHIFRPNTEGPFTSYCPPPEYPDFKLLRIHLTNTPGREWTCASYELPDSSACLLCVKGAADVLYCVRDCANPPQRLTVREGAAFFLPAGVVLYMTLKEEFVAFIAEAQVQPTDPA